MSSFVPPNVTDTAYGYMLGKNWGHGSAGSAGSKDSGSKAQQKWEEYVRKLESKLNEQKIQTERQFAIKEAALKEIARIDPHNSLLKADVRKSIADKGEEEARKAGAIS